LFQGIYTKIGDLERAEMKMLIILFVKKKKQMLKIGRLYPKKYCSCYENILAQCENACTKIND